MCNATRWSLLSGSVSLVMLLLVGCGSETPEVTMTSRDALSDGGGSQASSIPAQAASSAEAPAQGTPTAAPQTARANPAADSRGRDTGGGRPVAGTADRSRGNQRASNTAAGNGAGRGAVPQFPEDVTKWTPDDFRKATQASDKNLPTAIEHLVSARPGDPQVAGLLAEMLELVGQSNPGNGAQRRTSRSGAVPSSDPARSRGPAASANRTTSADPAGRRTSTTDPGPRPGYSNNGANLRDAANTANRAIRPVGAAGDRRRGYSVPGAPRFSRAGFGRGGAGVDTSDLVRVIVDALGRNGSQQAWLTLANVLAGQVKTVVGDDMIAEWVLTAAVENYGGDSHPTHQLLQAAVQTPEEVNPDRGFELKQQATSILVSMAAAVMDQLMGVPMADQSPRQRANDRGARGSRFRDPAMARGASPRGRFSSAGAQGFANGRQPTGSPQLTVSTRPLNDDAIRRAIQFLWRPEMLSDIEEQMQDTTAFEDNVETLALAGSLPMPGVRKSTFELFNRRWRWGAEPLLQQQLYRSIVRDPGMIVVLKLLPRLQPDDQTTDSGRSPNQQASRSSQGTQAKISWMKTSAYMVQAVNQRLYSASQKSGRPGMDPTTLPFKLHRGARIRSTYELNWPADLSDHVTDRTAPAQLTVQYVRMEIDADDETKTIQFYQRQLKHSKKCSFPNGTWLDRLTMGSEPGIRRSVDVIFMHPAAGNTGGAARGRGGRSAGARGNLGNAAGAARGRGGRSAGARGNLGNATGAARGRFGGNADRRSYGTGGARQQNDAGQYTIDVLVIEIPDPKPKIAGGK